MSEEQDDKKAKDEADLVEMKAELQEEADKIEALGYVPSDLGDVPDEAVPAAVERNAGDLREPMGFGEGDETSTDGAGDGADATDAAGALAVELGVDLSTVTGTGADGKITVGDVRAAAEKG